MFKKISSIIIVTLFLAIVLSLIQFKTGTIQFIQGENKQEVPVKFFEKVELPNVEKEHHTFLGWYSDDKKVEELRFVLGNKEVEAKFLPHNFFINYDTSEAEPTSYMPKVYTYGKITILPVLEKDNHTFIGWESDGKIINSISDKDFGTKNLKAIFEPNEYTIKYELNGGENNKNNPIKYTFGEELKLLNPTKKGYDFLGWFTDEKLKEKFVYTNNSSGNLVVYAGWSKQKVQSTTSTNNTNTDRNLEKPYVVCGKYSASLYSSDWVDGSEYYVLDGPGALHEFLSGKEYIADHNYQGASAFLYNNSLTVVRADGSKENYYKVSSLSMYWEPHLDLLAILAGMDGVLVTQTCSGDDIVFNGWNRR